VVRRTALQALATLGPAAAKALKRVQNLLDDRDTAWDAADALGRMGPAARPSLKALARLLSAQAPAERWAVVRAMAQIGGKDATPAVKFMIGELPRATDVERYNMLVYLALLGPVARDAIPAIRRSPVRNPFINEAVIWAIDPGTELPRLGEADFVQLFMESCVRELGDHLKPAAQGLARNIMAGRAGNVPEWGYKLLARFPNESLAILTPGLASQKLIMRERATVALGYLGRAAVAARSKVALALKAPLNEQERRLLGWCLRELE
jgi:hypothetical protein